MAKQLTDEELTKDLELFQSLVETLPEPRKAKVKAMLETETGLVFLSAPASSRTEFHSCFAGGLLRHSLNVTKFLNRLAKGFNPGKWQDGTLVFVGLFHDLGKSTDGRGSPVYVSNPSDWHREKLGALYELNKDVTFMAIPDRTIFLLQKFEVELSEEEFLAIRLADGQNIRENEFYRYREDNLAVLLSMANTLAERQEKASV